MSRAAVAGTGGRQRRTQTSQAGVERPKWSQDGGTGRETSEAERRKRAAERPAERC